jgi:hypothetical protein
MSEVKKIANMLIEEYILLRKFFYIIMFELWAVKMW